MGHVICPQQIQLKICLPFPGKCVGPTLHRSVPNEGCFASIHYHAFTRNQETMMIRLSGHSAHAIDPKHGEGIVKEPAHLCCCAQSLPNPLRRYHSPQIVIPCFVFDLLHPSMLHPHIFHQKSLSFAQQIFFNLIIQSISGCFNSHLLVLWPICVSSAVFFLHCSVTCHRSIRFSVFQQHNDPFLHHPFVYSGFVRPILIHPNASITVHDQNTRILNTWSHLNDISSTLQLVDTRFNAENNIEIYQD